VKDASRTFERMWYGGKPGLHLLPLAWLYGFVMTVRKVLYDWGWLPSYRVGRPVVVVGNLTVGGTGKTPLVAWLAEQLKARGLRVGIVSRGYGSNAKAPRVIEPDTPWSESGDEPLLLRRRTGCDVVVSTDRVAGAKLLVDRGADVILTDDGLQHLRLAREVEIVVVDGARGFGNGQRFPYGPLREMPSRAASANLVVINGSPKHPSLANLPRPKDLAPVQMSLLPGRVLPLKPGRADRTLESFRGQRVHAVAGIGNPARFFDELRSRGLQIDEHPFTDHHALVASDLAFGDGRPVLMTEKDAVKCRAFADARMWYVPVTAHFSDGESAALLQAVVARLNRSVNVVVQ
jgi:tetraacyldisaccharide 4'-kinase